MRVEYQGQIHEFPADFTDDDISSALMSFEADEQPTPGQPATPAAAPSVPTYVEGPGGQEVALNAEQYERMKAQQLMERQAADEAFAATRTPGQRAASTAAFAASAPVRALTRGEYGAGDVAKLAGLEGIAEALIGGEQSFARANQTGLEGAAALGEVGAGIPVLSSMGAVPGQMMRSLAANVAHPIRGPLQGAGEVASAYRPPAGSVGRLLREEAGSGAIPGGGGGAVPPGSPPVPPPAPAAPAGRYGPTRNEIIAAGERIRVPIPNMVAGNTTERALAGGLAAIPYAGAPVVKAWDEGLFGLGRARDTATERLGAPGNFNAGSAIRARVTDWIENAATPDNVLISEMYRRVGDRVRDVPANLQNLRNLQKELLDEKARTTTGAHDGALRLIQDMLDLKKFPQGMPYRDLLTKRMEIGARMKGDIAPEPGTSQPTLKRIYAAMSEDMKFALRRGGGKAGERAWLEANDAARQVAKERELLEAVIGKRGEVAPEKVIERLRGMARSRSGDVTRLQLLKRIATPGEWSDLAATIADDLGRSPKNGEFSVHRFTSDYGKISDRAKDLLFGEVRVALDDIALVAQQFERLYTSSFNTSKTGTANAVLALITNPYALIGGATAAALNPLSLGGTAAVTGIGLRGGRSMAFMLAKPAVAREASKVFRAYYNAATAARKGAEEVARREAGLGNAIRSYSLALAAETGGNAAEIQRALMAEIDRLRSTAGPKK